MDDLLPFFLHGDKKDIFEDYGYSSPKEAVMGIPIHYQNDGSFMYILTPVNSPPSTDSVRQWLTSGQRGDNQKSTGHYCPFSVLFSHCCCCCVCFVLFFFLGCLETPR